MDTRSVREYSPTKFHLFFAWLLRWPVRLLVFLKIDPNWITALSVGCAIYAAYAIFHGWWWYAILGILLDGFCDMSDGEVARRMPNRRTALKQWGELLDPVTDRIKDAFLFIGIIGYSLPPKYNGWFCLLLAFSMSSHTISSYIRTKVESMQARLQADKPLTRATFHVTVIAVCLCQALSWPSSEQSFFLWSTVVLVCAPTIYMFMRRLQMSYHVFNNQ